MNVPAIARKTFEDSRNEPELISIVNSTLEDLQQLSDYKERAEYIHLKVDYYNAEVFSHPLVKQFSPCKMGCSACCHTQVSITEDEGKVLSQKIKDGLVIDYERLKTQMMAQDNSDEFFKIPYANRKCIFLDDQGACRVYADRPSVCRTNVVLGGAEQCDSTNGLLPQRLVKTPKSDMVIYATYLFSKENGTLPNLVGKILGL